MRPVVVALAPLFLTFSAWGDEPKPATTKRAFNVICPAKELLPKLDLAYHRCNNGQESACKSFVTLLREALPEYDCQREFDRDAPVPALCLADAAEEDYIRLLSRL